MKKTDEQPLKTGREQSEYNSALLFLERINRQVFYPLLLAKVTKNWITYIDLLEVLFHELSTYMNKEEIEYFLKFFEDKKSEYQNINFMHRNKQHIKMNIDRETIQAELKLRKIFDEAGLQSKKKDDWLEPDEEW